MKGVCSLAYSFISNLHLLTQTIAYVDEGNTDVFFDLSLSKTKDCKR